MNNELGRTIALDCDGRRSVDVMVPKSDELL